MSEDVYNRMQSGIVQAISNYHNRLKECESKLAQIDTTRKIITLRKMYTTHKQFKKRLLQA